MGTYVVKAGDTLGKIGSQFGVDYKQISGYRSGNPNLIYPGEVLTIPDAGGQQQPASTQQPTGQKTPTKQPATSQPTPTAPSSGGGTPPPYAPNVVNQTVSYGGKTWKGNPGTGWTLEGGGTPGTSGASGISGISGFNQPTIDLVSVYNKLYETSGVTQKEKELSEKEKLFLEAKAKITDNPFLDASTLDKRLKRLQDKYDIETLPLRSGIATSKADLETQFNLRTKQFDVNSQQSQLAFTQFNTLLSSGALGNASGEDIAEIVRATGLPSSFVTNAIQASAKKEKKTQVITATSDSGEVTAVLMDTETGDIISKTSLGNIGNKQTGAGDAKIGSTEYNTNKLIEVNKAMEADKNSYGHVSPTNWKAARQYYVSVGLGTAQDFNKAYAGYTDHRRDDFEKAYGFKETARDTYLGE